MSETIQAADNHAALMDRIYRRQRYIYDFTRKYYLFGRDRLIRQLALKPGARVIEVGCGTARNLVKIAAAYPAAKLYGLDASSKMLSSAAQSLRQAGLEGHVKLVQAYADDLSPGLFGETDALDAVIFSYSLSMIPDWKQSLNASLAALAPHGRLHIVDFGDMKGLGTPLEWALRTWLGLFHVVPREELLKSIETGLAKGADGQLFILPGRYAFVLSCVADRIGNNPAWSVAGRSQTQCKSALQRPEMNSMMDLSWRLRPVSSL